MRSAKPSVALCAECIFELRRRSPAEINQEHAIRLGSLIFRMGISTRESYTAKSDGDNNRTKEPFLGLGNASGSGGRNPGRRSGTGRGVEANLTEISD